MRDELAHERDELVPPLATAPRTASTSIIAGDRSPSPLVRRIRRLTDYRKRQKVCMVGRSAGSPPREGTGCDTPEETHGEPLGHAVERAKRALAPRTARSRRRHRAGSRHAGRTRAGERQESPPPRRGRIHGRCLVPADGPAGIRRRADEERPLARRRGDQRRGRHRRQEDQPLDPRHRRHRSREDQDQPPEARQRQGRRALRGLPDPVAGLDGHQGELRRPVAQRLDLDRPGQADPAAAPSTGTSSRSTRPSRTTASASRAS